jgi:hypothetical protein
MDTGLYLGSRMAHSNGTLTWLENANSCASAPYKVSCFLVEFDIMPHPYGEGGTKAFSTARCRILGKTSTRLDHSFPVLRPVPILLPTRVLEVVENNVIYECLIEVTGGRVVVDHELS